MRGNIFIASQLICQKSILTSEFTPWCLQLHRGNTRVRARISLPLWEGGCEGPQDFSGSWFDPQDFSGHGLVPRTSWGHGLGAGPTTRSPTGCVSSSVDARARGGDVPSRSLWQWPHGHWPQLARPGRAAARPAGPPPPFPRCPAGGAARTLFSLERPVWARSASRPRHAGAHSRL